MTATDQKKIREGYEPIPGYVLEEAIGQGGFGEVWRASAPGGLKKAVKFVFGTQDQSRAARELRSLERIKGVQHPFLLTLERFEAIDDQLVIVTELADCSLEDVFKRNRDHGSCGVPRDVLINHLHDAADALDYLHQRYQLQHLDIKPGNLLLVGGHVKVADFGLLKDLREVECSVVGGLTPIYAPPEIFDGRPSMHSDQYSLAVMYQELLTGTRPFSGRTIAQLATQHVHSAPNLEPLPPGDRPVVAKALEKNPERRFANCTEFVDALRNSQGRSAKIRAVGGDLAPSDTQITSAGIEGAEPIEDLPQLRTRRPQSSRSDVQPAMVVALGGTGAECLRELRHRVADVHSESPLDLHSVLIDTDMATVHSMRVGEVSDRTPKCNVIFTPLRKAQEYRQQGTDRLSTISRRWIYNVPRSGATEGMRPLGRLALVDHGPIVRQRLSESLAELAECSGDQTPTVYVVGSLTGGTGSGIFVDVIHLLRHLLDDAGMVETPILSFMATAPLQGDPSRPLALHDAQAAMTELRYFLQPGNGYPGDAGAGWPSVPAARTPLRDVYVVAGATQGNLAPPPAETITDYIWSDACGAGEVLAAARKLELKEDTSIIPPSIRSVGVVALGRSNHLERKVLAPSVVRELLIKWLGLPSTARQAASGVADRIMRRISLSAESIVQEIEHGFSPQQRAGIETAGELHTCLKAVDEMIVDGQCASRAERSSSSLNREISVGLNDRRTDVTTVIESLKLIAQRSEKMATGLRALPGAEADVEPIHAKLTLAARHVAAHQLEKFAAIVRQHQERCERFATTLAMSMVEASKLQSSDANQWDKMPEPIKASFDRVVSQLHGSAVNRFLIRSVVEANLESDAPGMVNAMIDMTVPNITAVLDEHRELLAESDHQSVSETTSTTTTSSAVRFNDSHTQTAVTYELESLASVASGDQPLSIEDALVAVKPSLLTFGGLQRLMLLVGNEQERGELEAQVRQAHDGPLTVAVIPGATPKLIHEAQQVELTNVLSRLSILNGGNTQVTGRLSSRTDVTW